MKKIIKNAEIIKIKNRQGQTNFKLIVIPDGTFTITKYLFCYFPLQHFYSFCFNLMATV